MAIFEKDGFNLIPPAIAIAHMGYSPSSSTGMRALAGLIYFGLAEDIGIREDRRIKLSELGKTLVLDKRENSLERRLAMKEAALTPKIYRRLWEGWGPDLPSDQTLEFHLIRDFEFNRNSVKSLLRDFRETVEFAHLLESDAHDHTASGAAEAGNTSQTESATLGTNKISHTSLVPIQDESTQVVPIPLFNGRFATLSIPKPLSKRDYLHLKSLVNTMLDGMESLFVEDTDA